MVSCFSGLNSLNICKYAQYENKWKQIYNKVGMIALQKKHVSRDVLIKANLAK